MTNSKMLQVAIDAAKAAEQEILNIYKSDFEVSKKSDQTPVTLADQKAEEVIRATISKTFPNHGFLGEEYGSDNPDAEYIWIIDPIDGTKNFTRRIPFFGTEIALMHQGELIIGVSNLPAYNQISWAEKGQGAFCNGEQIHVSNVSTLQNAYLSGSNFKYFIEKKYINNLLELSKNCYVARAFGDSFAYHFLAKGSLEIIIEANVKIWDIAAITTIVREAGGTVTDITGKPVTIHTDSIIATNGKIHTAVLGFFQQS